MATTNRVPATCCFQGVKVAEITVHQIWTAGRLVHNLPAATPYPVKVHFINDSESRHFHLFEPLNKYLTWQTICVRRWRESCCHLLSTDAWHQLLLCQDESLGVTVGQMLNVNGNYIVVWSNLSATNVPRVNKSRIQFAAWQCSLLHFFNLKINHLKTASASISLKVSWISLLVLLLRVPCRWQMTMDYWLNYTNKGNRSTRRKICRCITLPTTKPATNVIKMNLSNRLVLLLRPFLQTPGEVPQMRPDGFLPHPIEFVTNLTPNIHWRALKHLPGKNLYFTCGSVPI